MEDKVVLITGASTGIGASTAECLAKAGYKKLALVARRKEKLEAVAAKCKAHGAVNVAVFPIDLATREGAIQAVKDTVGYFQRKCHLRYKKGPGN